jgi:hypothetical protein
MSAVGVTGPEAMTPILAPEQLQALAASVESLAWRRRGHEKRSLVTELGRRFRERSQYVPCIGVIGHAMPGEASNAPSVSNADQSSADKRAVAALSTWLTEDIGLAAVPAAETASALCIEGWDSPTALQLATENDLAACGLKAGYVRQILHKLHAPPTADASSRLHAASAPVQDAVVSAALPEEMPSSDSTRSTGEVDAASSVEAIPDVTVAPPWADAKACMLCGAGFTIMTQRHHCRKCGKTVCTACSPRRAPVTHSSEGIEAVRVCSPCFEAITASRSSGVAEIPPAHANPLLLESTEVSSRLSLRKVYTAVYTKDGDECGVFYFLGTRLGGDDRWIDPCARSLARVFASSVGHGLVSSLLSRRRRNRFHTQDERNAWVLFEFLQGFAVQPTAYTLFHGDGWDSLSMRTPRRLRSWRLEGLPAHAKSARETAAFETEWVSPSSYAGR